MTVDLIKKESSLLLQVPIIMVSKMEVYESQEHSTKRIGVCLVAPPEQSTVDCLLWVCFQKCLFGRASWRWLCTKMCFIS